MTDLRQAAQQALHELEGIPIYRKYGVRISNAITALRTALEQQQAEPPPEWPLIKNIIDEYGLDAISFVAEWKAAQQQAEPTCPDCKAAVLYECVACSNNNYPPKQQAEPVAYLCENAVGHKYFRWKKPSSTYKPIALYTAPPQRPWVGLTDDEMSDTVADMDVDFGDLLWKVVCLTKIIEAKLKERNGY